MTAPIEPSQPLPVRGEGPLQQAAVSGNGNVVVQIAGDGNTVVVGYAHLTLTRYLNRRLSPGQGGTLGEAATLLSPYALSLPLVGREGVLADFWAWMRESRPVAVRVMTAPAGTGKTRLALELCEQAFHAGWDAGFLIESELVRFRAAQNLSAWGWRRPTLMVVDYAASRARLLRDWLIELADNPGQAGMPLRLLLLERHADPSGGWWREAFGVGGGDAEAVQRLLDSAIGPYRLQSLAAPDERREVLTSVLQRVGSAVRPPEPGDSPLFDQRIAEISWGGEPLFLLMAGLVAARAGFGDVLALSGTDLGFRIAGHELHRIEGIAGNRGIPPRFLAHLAAYVTLCQGLSHAALETVIEEEKEGLLYRSAGDPPEIGEALAAALPFEEGVAPIVPDLVGEAVILQAFGAGRADKALTALARANGRAGEQVTAVLIRLTQDYGAVRAEPLAWLRQIAEEGAEDLDRLLALLRQFPGSTLNLREVAATLTQKAIDSGREKMPKKVLAWLLGTKSRRLRSLGKREEALAAVEEAVALRRELASSDSAVFLPGLAGALDQLSIDLRSLGRGEEALKAREEALAIFRQLAVSRPGRFRRNLAGLLNNLSNDLSALGRREEALTAVEEAVAIYRELGLARPLAPRRSGLARSLANLAGCYKQLGRLDEALTAIEEALEIWRELAARRPDAFRPALASSLGRWASCLGALGRKREALEAAEEGVAIQRALAALYPAAFAPVLAGALEALSNRLRRLGQREKALKAAQEASGLYRDLAQERPAAFRPALASSLHGLANTLANLGREGEAVAAVEESVAIWRDLAAFRREAFASSLASALDSLAVYRRVDLPASDRSLRAAEESVAIRRELAARRPLAARAELASSLSTLASCLAAAGSQEEALAAAQEAVGAYRELAREHPAAFRSKLAMSLYMLSAPLGALGSKEEALAAARESVEIYRKLAPTLPEVYRSDLAIALRNLSGPLIALGRREEALGALRESSELFRQLAVGGLATFRQGLANSLADLSAFLRSLDRKEEALMAAEEAVQLFLPLLLGQPRAFQSRAEQALRGYLQVAEELGREPDPDLVAALQGALSGASSPFA